ncbi:hypothetical protein V6Z12_A05G109900 [Gossypium hirsutum]
MVILSIEFIEVREMNFERKSKFSSHYVLCFLNFLALLNRSLQ